MEMESVNPFIPIAATIVAFIPQFNSIYVFFPPLCVCAGFFL